jgi:PAS domain S-box-containing protein
MLIIDSELQEYLVEILNQSKNGIVISDPNQENNPIIFVNQNTCKRFEYEKEDFLGKNCNFLQGEDTNQIEIQQLSAAIRKRKPITVTLRNYTKTGQLIYNEVAISPIFDTQNNIKYFLGIQKDVTKEIALKEANETLVEQRINDAQYSAIGKLSAGLSHEINTPLTIIKGNMEMLKHTLLSLEDSDDKKYMIEDLESIQNNLNRIKNLTETMREIADTEQFEIKSINLYRTLIIALRLTHNKGKKITPIMLQNRLFDLDIDREAERFSIYGDNKKLEQAFVAIIDNALDQLEQFGRFEENLLKIEIEKTKEGLKVTFQDNGKGISENLLENIFKPFKGDKTHRGLGIGLSVVKKIIDEHQFDITITNNNGALVTVIIPVDLDIESS